MTTEPELNLIPGMAAPKPGIGVPGGLGVAPAVVPTNFPDTSQSGPVALESPVRWEYDFDPASGNARASFPGLVLAPFTSDGSIDVRWYIETPGTPAQNTAGIQAAFNAVPAGGGRVVFPPGVTWPLAGGITTANPTLIDLNGGTIADSAGSTGNLLTISHAGSQVQGGTIQATASSSGVNLLVVSATSNVQVRNLNLLSKTYNPRFTNTYSGATNGLFIGALSGVNPPYPALWDRMVVDNLYIYGCINPIRTMGLSNSRITRCFSYMPVNCNFVFGAGMPCFNTYISQLYGYGGGNYCFQSSNLNANDAGMWQQPYQGLSMRDIMCVSGGWGSLYAGTQSVIGTGKSGFAIASTDMFNCDFQGKVWNCCKGGGEYKYTTTPPSPSTPTGFLYHRVDVDVQMCFDNGVGFFIATGATTVGSTTFGKTNVDARCQLVAPYPWTTGNRYDPWTPVASAGGLWVCLGDDNGVAGNAGASAPTTGTATLLTGCTIDGGDAHIIHYTTLTAGGTLTVGDTIFCGTAMPDGAKIASFDTGAKTVTSDTPSTGAISTSVVTATEFKDGSLWWRYVDADRSAAPTSSIGVSVQACNSVTLTGSARGYFEGLELRNNQSLDNVLSNITVKSFDTQGITAFACRCAGNGTSTNITFESCNLNGGTTGVQIADAGSTWTVNMLACRISAFVGSNNPLFLNGGTVNLQLDGCMIEGSSKCVAMSASGVNKVYAGSSKFIASGGSNGIPVQLTGAAGSLWDWQNAIIDNSNRVNVRGYSVGGSMVATGSPHAADLERANAVPTTNTKGEVGEFFYITPPTATVRGYVVQSTTAGAAPFTWRAMVVA